MTLPDLTPEPVEQAERIAQTLRAVSADDLRQIAPWLASKPAPQLLGQAEFEVRDRGHPIGAKAIETALDARETGGTQGPAGGARVATARARSRTGGTRPSSA